MTDMKKLLQIVTESGEKTRIDESVNVSINVSGDSPCDVGEVLAKVTNLSSPRPVTPDMMPAPSVPPPMPMMKAIDIVNKADQPTDSETPPPPPGNMSPPTAPEAIGQNVMQPDPSEGPSNGPSTSSQVAPPMTGVSIGGDEAELEALISQAEEELGLNDMEEGPNLNQYARSASPEDDNKFNKFGNSDDDDDWRDDLDSYSDGSPDESLLDPAMGSAHGEGGESKALNANSNLKDIHARLREIDRALQRKNEEFKNQPDPKYSDTNYMTKDLAGGLNKPKAMHKNSYKQGDNPMAMEDILRDEWERYKLEEASKG